MLSHQPASRPRVLVVDDEPEIRSILTELLETDYDCEQADCAEGALELLAARRFDLLVSDITMRGMSGLELIGRARELAPDTVIIMISGLQNIESAIAAMRVGAFDYLTKPFDLEHVRTAVARALEHAALREAKRRYETQLEELVERRTAELHGALASVEDAYRATLRALSAALEARDHETHGHSRRVVAYSLRLGRELGLDEEQLRSLEFGSLLHDIGKIGVPDAILRKPARLTEEEWARMREHPRFGERILRGIEFLKGAARVVAEHHERWDGTGYPRALRGDEIDLGARIFAVADAFDAITSDRVYRRGKPYEAAAAELEEWAGSQFDPQVVAAFRRVPQGEWEELRREANARERESAAGASDADRAAGRAEPAGGKKLLDSVGVAT